MKRRKRISKSKRINLDSLYPIVSVNPSEVDMEENYEYYDKLYNLEDSIDEEDYSEIPKTTHTIPDGETEFIKAIKQGEDW